ncbi:MAG: hypothetical protein EBR82_47030 [Caulobacteraceae bacterium]|nr:hypothetical protein [Caulobacteraceae bacterium]
MTDDPYGRQAAHDAVTDWQEREAQQMADKAWSAARNIAADHVARQNRIDGVEMGEDEFAAAVEAEAQRLHDAIVGALPPNPLAPYLIDWSEFWATDHDETEWLLEPLFADGRSHALYAGAKTGKSYLVLAACAALATGQPFLQHQGGDPVHVLYLDYEMSPQDVRERLEEFGYGPGDDLSHLHYALLPSLPPLDTAAGGEELLAGAQACEARFVVVDTTSRAIQGDENDADTIRAFYRHTGLRLKQAGIGWLRLDHAGKDVEKGQRGSSAKNDDVDVVARVERTDTGPRWIATHRRMSWYPEVTDIALVERSGVMVFANVGGGPVWPAGTGKLAEELDRIGVPLEASRKLARWYMDQEGIKGQNKILGPALKWRRVEAQRVADMDAEELVRRLESKADRPADRTLSTDACGQDGPDGPPRNIKADRPADRGGPGSDADADRGRSLVEDRPGPAWSESSADDPDDTDEAWF